MQKIFTARRLERLAENSTSERSADSVRRALQHKDKGQAAALEALRLEIVKEKKT